MNDKLARHVSTRVAVVVGGAWGTALALLSLRAENPAWLVVRDDLLRQSMVNERRHPRSLPGIDLPAALHVTTDVDLSLERSDVVILAIPTQKIRDAIAGIADALRGRIVVSAAKGIEVGTSMRPTQVLEDVLGANSDTPICALSGPNLAGEIASGKPAATVVASRDSRAAGVIQRSLMSEAFRVYTSADVVGVEMGGALKNIIAIGAGIGDGLNAGDNAKAAFMTRGIVEISHLGGALGAEPSTFAGLSGIGDLIATCSSPMSHNHRVGVSLAAGKSLAAIRAEMQEVSEGIDTTRAAIALARHVNVEMPITEQMSLVLFEGKSPVEAVHDLMSREPQSE